MVNIGIDVSKNKLDIKILPSGDFHQVSNSKKGVNKLVKILTPLSRELIVIEPNGGHEKIAYHTLSQEGFKVALVNPRKVRSFATTLNQLAKTDKIDDDVLAKFAIAIKPPVRAIPEKTISVLQAKIRRRTDLVIMKTAKNLKVL